MNGLNISVQPDETKEEMDKERKKWEIEDAVRILLRAEEIKQDAELMKLVQPEIQKHAKAAINIAQTLYGKEDNDNENKNN